MRTLFFKLFVAFLLAMSISGAVFFSLAYWARSQQQERHPALTGDQFRHELKPLLQPLPPKPGPDGMGPPPPRAGHPPPPPFFMVLGFQVAIFLVVGGCICYLLAWRITAPVRRLRQAVQQLADGNLKARTGIETGRRGDEITDLGSDFDRMAERIEALVLSQRQLVRDISHELRSPLARLQVALGLARRDAPPRTEQALGRIEREGERLNELIGELLTLSLLENGASFTASEPVEMQALLTEIVEDASFEAAESSRQVQLVSVPALVAGNHELLRRALENVVRNALHYTAEGTCVQVASGLENSTLVIRVLDQGPGVPDEMLSAIFQPFYRVAEARDRLSGGTGIGLAITARAVALHGGSVKAVNRPEAGLEVEIRLPVRPLEEKAAPD
ncbi:ATP-binding protein [Trichlorobacter lovleyi]|uniref:ATP-binding protein n=1 Tax=Trichlorobacter lovleyi TaxID=313985 RepID=UPI00247FBD2A|nr:ATP-binding protein [Trichlorobacter lovleyi]